jgi:hypothetical protein
MPQAAGPSCSEGATTVTTTTKIPLPRKEIQP